MRFTRWLIATLVLATVIPAPRNAFAQGGDRLLPSASLLNRHNLVQAWWAQATLNPARDKVEHIVADEDCVFVHSNSGLVTAFDAESGEQLWAHQLGKFDGPSFPTTANDTQAMIVVGTKMFGIAKRTGKLLWELRLPGQPSTGPSTDDINVYVGMLDGSVYAFDFRAIRELYRDQKLPQWSHLAVKWRYRTSNEVTSPPVTTGRVVDFATRGGSLYSVGAEERELFFQFESDAPILAPITRTAPQLVVNSDIKLKQAPRLFVASEDMTIFCINAENGSVLWDFCPGLPIRTAPYCVGSTVFLAPDRGGMYSLATTNGTQNWWNSRATTLLAVAGEMVYAADNEGDLLILDRASGQTQGKIPTRQFAHRVSNDRTDRIYLCSRTGGVLCLRQASRPFPSFYQYPDRLPLLPPINDDEAESASDDNEPEMMKEEETQ